MSRPAFITIPSTDIDVDTALKAQTLRDLRVNTDHARVSLFCISHDTAQLAGRAGASWYGLVWLYRLFIPDLPDYSGGGLSRSLKTTVRLCRHQTDSSGQAEVRLKDVGSSTYSTVATSTVSGSVVWPYIPDDQGELTLTIPDAWAGTWRELLLQGRATGGATWSYFKFYADAGRLEY